MRQPWCVVRGDVTNATTVVCGARRRNECDNRAVRGIRGASYQRSRIIVWNDPCAKTAIIGLMSMRDRHPATVPAIDHSNHVQRTRGDCDPVFTSRRTSCLTRPVTTSLSRLSPSNRNFAPSYPCNPHPSGTRSEARPAVRIPIAGSAPKGGGRAAPAGMESNEHSGVSIP
jgi:hypothetical protein